MSSTCSFEKQQEAQCIVRESKEIKVTKSERQLQGVREADHVKNFRTEQRYAFLF